MSEEKKDKPNLESQFKEAFSYFGPTLISQLFAGGTEAAKVTQAQMDRMRQDKLARAKLAQEQRIAEADQKRAAAKEGREERSVKVREKGQATREKELAVDEKREATRQEEVAIKRYEDAVSKFTGRKDIQKFRDFQGTINSIQDMVTSGKKIPGASLSLVAKGLAKEVGVLTNQDIERSQVNPDILSKLKRGFYTYFKGEISPDDAKEMLKIAKAINEKEQGRFKKIAEKEASFRGARFSDQDKKRLRKDYLNQIYIYEDEDEKKQEADDNALIDKYL